MADIKIVVSKDKLEARISIKSDEYEFPSKNEILQELKNEGIIYGIDFESINSIIAAKKPIRLQLIAKGMLPERRKSAELAWHIEINYSNKPTFTDSNRADYKKLKLFERVRKNQNLVSIIPAKEGVVGKNVLGEDIVDNGNRIELPAGKNTIISDDGLKLLSAIDGYAYWENDLLCINNVYKIEGNVDYHTGNIRANGTVLIEGDVRSGFRVEATESIIVKGNVEAANIYSQNGDISIECGILGGGRAKILAGGNLTCGFVQDATVSIKGSIHVKHYVINSKVSSGSKIAVDKNEGLIRGGLVSSGTGIHVLQVGSGQKIFTELNIRLGDSFRESSQSWHISKKRRKLQTRLYKFKNRIAFLQLLQERIDDLSENKRAELQKLIKDVELLNQDIDKLQVERQKLKDVAHREIQRNEIVIENKLFKNVKIDFGGIEYIAEDEMESVKIFREKNEIIFERLSLN